ncbi:hypothetical protein PPERSA_04167 [Pseudocohnilembus persalinus]|uniref:Uncharacterized protein n=1 Tax=Pseudocohnilembus persalinus TaxID=266149 RepID=A0A0V0QMQ2_PSEPJ|nr:hypothetical protein PPERSA_04167 [Pseudocohnilembus persalinus]|eukprot:KRX03615.1 hypothetical protein PPERSA_04167 [Pseudocohnilembus persalinus]
MIDVKDIKYNDDDEFDIRESEFHIFEKDNKDKTISIMLIASTSLDPEKVKKMKEDEKIKKIEGIQSLKKLEHLNLGDNLIEDYEAEDIPEQVHMIVLKGNPVQQKEDYKIKIINSLPYVDYIDGEDITMEQKFKMLGIFPQEIQNYSAGYRNYYLENLEKIQKIKKFEEKVKQELLKQKIEEQSEESDESEEEEQKEKQNEVQNKNQQNISENETNKNEEIIKENQQNVSENNDNKSQISENSQYEDQEMKKLMNDKYDLEMELKRRENEDAVQITEDIVDQLFNSKYYFKKKAVRTDYNYKQQLFDLTDEEIKRKLQDKTLRILERQKERTFMMKKKHLEKMKEEAELQSNKITLVRASKMNQTGRVGNYNAKEDSALSEISEFFQEQLQEYEENYIKNKIRKTKQDKERVQKEFEEELRKSQQFFNKNDEKN